MTVIEKQKALKVKGEWWWYMKQNPLADLKCNRPPLYCNMAKFPVNRLYTKASLKLLKVKDTCDVCATLFPKTVNDDGERFGCPCRLYSREYMIRAFHRILIKSEKDWRRMKLYRRLHTIFP